MSLAQGSNIVRNGLIFHYDSFLNDRWFSKSYKGKPTVNYAWNQNAVAQSSYTPYTNSGGTWNIKHPNAIRAYNKAGTDITGYVNTGANSGDWTNMYHAVWEYDNVLKKPVVVMRNWDGSQWKAKNWSLGKSYSTMGLGYGDTYTISWLQWTDNIGRTPNVGLYGQNTSGTNGFHDGLSGGTGGSTHASTKAETWQRVYKTYTVSSANNLTAGKNCYMYGHYGGAGVIKIADVQIEVGLPSPFIAETSEATSTRVDADVFTDLAGGNAITPTNIEYQSDGSFNLVGTATSSRIGFNNGNSYPLTWDDPWTLECWHYVPDGADWHDTDTYGANGGTGILGRGGYSGSMGIVRADPFYLRSWIRTDGGSNYFNYTAEYDKWYHCVQTLDGTGLHSFYVNGVGINASTITKTGIPDVTGFTVGGGMSPSGTNGGYGEGKTPVVRMYNRAITMEEAKQNFEAERGRYGI